MTTTYYFHSAGALPIIGGIYAGVAVEVDEAHREILSITPLSSNPPEILAAEEITPVAEETPEIKES